MDYDIDDIDIVARLWGIIERSSLGTPEARRFRESADRQQVERILEVFYGAVEDAP